MSLLGAAALAGHQEVIQRLPQGGATVNQYFGSGYTALHFATRCGFVAIVGILIEAGANPTLLDWQVRSCPDWGIGQ
jgi:ankyrin repeat protein